MDKKMMQTNYGFWLKWTLATMVGWGLGAVIGMFLVPYELGLLFLSHYYISIEIFLFGIGAAITQAILLDRAPNSINAGKWIILSFIGWGLALLISLVFDVFSIAHYFGMDNLIFELVMRTEVRWIGGIFIVSVLQWLALRSRKSNISGWIIGTGWVLGNGIVWIIVTTIWEMIKLILFVGSDLAWYSSPNSYVFGVFVACILGAMIGIASGGLLTLWLRISMAKEQ